VAQEGPRSVKSVRSPCDIDDLSIRDSVENLYLSYH